MLVSLRTFGILPALMLCCLLVQAQQNQNNPTGEKSQTSSERLREKAFDLLESLADQIGTLQSAENRARVASNLAASLWTHDERRARTLLVAVENEIRTELQSLDGDDATDNETRMVFLQLRIDTVERISRYDADSALAFFKATEMNSDKPRHDGAEAMGRSLELRLAKQVAADNPDVALSLGRQRLKQQFSDDLTQLVLQLNRKHREQAQILYKEIVAKLGDADLAGDDTTFYYAQLLVRSFRPPEADDQTFRNLIGLFIKTALEHGCGDKMSEEDERANLCQKLGWLWPQMQKVDPSRARRLKQWAPEEEEEDLTDIRLSEDATVDEILALAAKYPQLKEQLHWRALLKAEESGDSERARKIANDFDGDAQLKQRMLAEIEHDQAWATINEKKLDELQKELNARPRIQDRIELLFNVAIRTAANDRKTSLKLLDQAGAMIEGLKPGSEQTWKQMQLAVAYCFENNDRGLAIMEALVPKLNELVSASVKLDGYETHNLRAGEWNMSESGVVGGLLTILSQNAGHFAWCDFDRAVNIAAQFERPELRIMAQLKLAQSLLTEKPRSFQVAKPRERLMYDY